MQTKYTPFSQFSVPSGVYAAVFSHSAFCTASDKKLDERLGTRLPETSMCTLFAFRLLFPQIQFTN